MDCRCLERTIRMTRRLGSPCLAMARLKILKRSRWQEVDDANCLRRCFGKCLDKSSQKPCMPCSVA